jgi:hypothetical protein
LIHRLNVSATLDQQFDSVGIIRRSGQMKRGLASRAQTPHAGRSVNATGGRPRIHVCPGSKKPGEDG